MEIKPKSVHILHPLFIILVYVEIIVCVSYSLHEMQPWLMSRRERNETNIPEGRDGVHAAEGYFWSVLNKPYFCPVSMPVLHILNFGVSRH